MSPPDGLYTPGCHKHDVALNPHIIAPDPFASDDCLDVFSPVFEFLLPEPQELNTMNSSEDEPSSGLNGRLRPRKSTIPSPQSLKQITRKSDGRSGQEKPKRSSTPSKASPSKSNEPSKSDLPSTPQLLCPYCDRKFVSKQSISKHVRRLHLSASKPDSSMVCLFCNHVETEPVDVIRHMVDSHPNQYFACLDCHSRFPSTKELAEHKLNVCEKQKIPYRSKLRQKSSKKSQKSLDTSEKDYRNGKNFSGLGFNGIVISCELKPSHVHDEADIEDNITTNLILPPNKNLNSATVLEKNAVIVLDDIQWNRRIPSNFSFHNADADQILSRLGVVHRSPKTGDSSKKDFFRAIEDATQKFEKCFDTSFYSKVASNVQENLSKFLDGSFNFNPDPDSTIKTRKSKNSVVIHTAEGFPILLACEQFSRNNFDGYMPRTIAPKHKWKWDNLENERLWNTDQIKRDTHANNCIITLVSSLDIWTQLCMRRKFEEKFNITPIEKKTEKQNLIGKQLKEILESREIPSVKSQIVKYSKEPPSSTNERDFPSCLGLMPSTPKFNIKPAVLSGEWVRPRCYVCCACGAQTRDSRSLGAHVSTQHPNSQVQHYEIVGESLLNADILKHLYVPPSQNINRTRPPRGFKDCTKCNKSITIEDLHQHMLDCAGDTPAIRRKCRYRPFGVRKRRSRLPDNRIRKKIRNDIRTRPTRQKSRIRPRPKIRTEVGDAETIRKMLADLPAKRHRVLVNPLNSILRPRRKHEKQRVMLRRKRRTSEDTNNVKPRTSNNSIQHDLPANNDKNQSIPNNNDDDDNKPLKPRLKRVTRKITRKKETLNRKEVFNRPKRKLMSGAKTNNESDDHTGKVDLSISCAEKVETEELSLENNEKRINLSSDPQNIREHSSGREGSFNGRRDNERPGCSGQNGNSRNVIAPAQNVPLKHSIARLTANSETHDKSVQFHHLFLVQQECNNVNQHVPSGQRVLFENEAIVTKLDKPPLHFSQMEPIPGHNIKSVPGFSSGTIAEQKGETKPEYNLQPYLPHVQPHAIDSIHTQKVGAMSSRNIHQHSVEPQRHSSNSAQGIEFKPRQKLEYIQEQNEYVQGHSAESMQGQTTDALQKSKLNKPRKGLNDCIAMLKNKLVDTDPTTSVHVSVQCGTDDPIGPEPVLAPVLPTRRSSDETLLQPAQSYSKPPQKEKKSPTKSNPVLPLPRDSTYGVHFDHDLSRSISIERPPVQWRPINYDAITPRYNSSKKEIPRRRSTSQTENLLLAQQLLTLPSNDPYMQFSTEIYNTYHLPPQKVSKPRQRSVRQTTPVNEVAKRIVDSQIYTEQARRSLDVYESNALFHTERSKKSLEVCEDNKRARSRSDASRKSLEMLEKIAPIIPDDPKSTNDLNDKRNKALELKTPQNISKESLEGAELPEILAYPKVLETQENTNLQIDANLPQLEQAMSQKSRDMNIKDIPLNTYTEHAIQDKQVTIPPAHSNAKADSIVPKPLDLSGKISTKKETFPVPRKSLLVLTPCPTYETLDLSNKSKSSISDNVVVDLRIKQSSCLPISKTSECFQKDSNVASTLSLAHQNTYVSADFSNNRKFDNLLQKPNSGDKHIDNFSKNKTINQKEDYSLLDIQGALPTDLSHKNNANNEQSILSTSTPKVQENDANNLITTYENVNVISEPEDLSGKIGDEKCTNSKPNISITKASDIPEKISENMDDQESTNISQHTSGSYYSENLLDPSKKPVYDPTLRIPQYKIRPSEENGGTESRSSTIVSTCSELYKQSQNSFKSDLVSCESQTNSMITSTEVQESLTYSLTSSSLNVAVTAITECIPAYKLLNNETSIPFTTVENTKPVYTLAGTSISFNKIEETKSTPILTKSLLSSPSTTTSTTPIYTLAGTTVLTPMNCGTLPNTGHAEPFPPCCTYIPETENQAINYKSSSSSSNIKEVRLNDNDMISDMFNYERNQEATTSDSETLPKEIMAVLGLMPVDPRNQLLDVLKQYLPVSRPISVLSVTNSLFAMGPTLLSLPIRISKELTVDASTETVDIKPLYSQTFEDASIEPKTEKSQLINEVIDLTDDEIVPKPDLDNVEDEEEKTTLLAQEIADYVGPKLTLPKSNDTNTASLRAVRIKTPSERQKSKLQISQLQSPPDADNLSTQGGENSDTEILTSLDTDASSDIQLYEVSSSQQSNVSGQSIISPNKSSSQMNGSELKDSKSKIVTEKHFSMIHLLDLKQTDNEEKDSTGRLNKNRVEDDDDSEDDISLAVIVKQKRQEQNSLNNSLRLKNADKKKRSTNQKNKNTNRHVDKLRLTDTSSGTKTIHAVISNKNTVKEVVVPDADLDNAQFNDIANCSIANSNDCSTRMKRKKKTKKNRRNVVSSKKVVYTEVMKEGFQETGINKENDKLNEDTNNVNVTIKNSKSKHHDGDSASFGTGTELSSREIKVPESEELASHLNKLKDVLNKTARLNDNAMNHKILYEFSKEENENTDTKDNGSILVCSQLKVSSNDPLIISDELPTEKSDPMNTLTNSIAVSSIPNIDTKIGKNDDTDSGTIIENTKNLALTTPNANDSELPLRRSRRGKSFYAERNEQGVIHSDTPAEQRAPLTKKQLIFSKLLLDEENFMKNQIQTDNKQPVSLPHCSNTTTFIENKLAQNISAQSVIVPNEEKNKPNKRKKSPSPKKKSKKKKSVETEKFSDDLVKKDEQPIMNEDNFIENQQADKTILTNTVEHEDLNTIMSNNSQIQNKSDVANNNEQTSLVHQNQSMPGSTEKRKIASLITKHEEFDSSKPKKSKINNIKDNAATSHEDESDSSLIKKSPHVLIPARRTRSKSVVVKSFGSMSYDPYDIELEDMGESTEPFRKQRLSLKTNVSKTCDEPKIETSSKKESTIPITEPEILSDNATTVTKTFSDSDDSSKSDVPLKKYVEEKERRNVPSSRNSSSKASNDVNGFVDCNESIVKQSKKKNKKVKRTDTLHDDILKADAEAAHETQEQLQEQRSEQFMESFGFFSERKPRKSNLLASKKISETFHSIANESDDVYFKTKDRSSKKTSRSENRKLLEEGEVCKLSAFSNSPKSTLKRLKKLSEDLRYCHVCKKEFRRPDNLLRHQMTLFHVSRLAEFELNAKTVPVPDDPNYLVIFKQHLDRLSILQNKLKNKKHSKSKIVLPTMQQIVADVRRTAKEQQLARRSLSNDEALFLDCCELLKDSNSNSNQPRSRSIRRPFLTCCASSYALACASEAAYGNQAPSKASDNIDYSAPSTSGLPKKPVIYLSAKPDGMPNYVMMSSKETSKVDNHTQSSSKLGQTVSNAITQTSDEGINTDEKSDCKSEGDVDSVTAQSILNSEEVRNLENDLLSGLKESACKFQPILNEEVSKHNQDELVGSCGSNEVHKIDAEVEKPSENEANTKTKKRTEVKEKKIPDLIENIDIFEDKFDKIKRKCRSQAAAAKQVQTVMETSISHKSRKKSEKKKCKKGSKKSHQNTVLTKGALKGYDSIKVSIQTSDIDMSAIPPPINTAKKKKRSSSRKKKEKRILDETYKSDSNRAKEKEQNNVDVYEFMDNEEPEIFELRPSTIMERFRNINNRLMPSSSKNEPSCEEAESSDSASDGDDFVYMSDAYISDDESNEGKKSPSPLKRKEVTEKNAVMDRIFKNNAVRSEKKSEPEESPSPVVKPTADLDQLFDSLLEDEPNSSALIKDDESPKVNTVQKKRVFTPIELSKYDLNPPKNKEHTPKKYRTPSPALSTDSAVSKRISPFSSRESSPRRSSRSRFDAASPSDFGPSTSKRYDELKHYNKRFSKDSLHSRPSKYDRAPKSNILDDDLELSPKTDESLFKSCKLKSSKSRSPSRKKEKVVSPRVEYDFRADYYDEDVLSDDAGVARQRARRKCTVGKQNVLAETWSSESEPDAIPPRPTSAESVVLSVSRKKKGRKKEMQISGSRKANKQASTKKADVENRGTSSNRSFGVSNSGFGAERSGSSSGPSSGHAVSLPAPAAAPRLHHPRAAASFWADGDDEQEHVQQHGWIVGDSHKKLVTMLAHAKGRKRNNDDKRHMIE